MWVDKAVADILCEMSPEYRQHRRDDGWTNIGTTEKIPVWITTGSEPVSQISLQQNGITGIQTQWMRCV